MLILNWSRPQQPAAAYDTVYKAGSCSCTTALLVNTFTFSRAKEHQFKGLWEQASLNDSSKQPQSLTFLVHAFNKVERARDDGIKGIHEV